MSARGWALGGTLLVLAIHVLPEELRAEGMYLSDALQRKEAYRWLFAHFIHRSWSHLAFNLGTWLLACWVLAPVLARRRRWTGGLPLVAIGICASLAWLDPQSPPFVGFSALIYSWLVAGALQGFALRPRRSAYALLVVVLLAKAAIEHWLGEGVGWGELGAIGPSAVLAHHHAVVWGMLWGLLGVFPDLVRSFGLLRGRDTAL